MYSRQLPQGAITDGGQASSTLTGNTSTEIYRMNDPELPATPARSISDLRTRYIRKAEDKSKRTDEDNYEKRLYIASAKTFGTKWGVGVGLHFELLKWLRLLSLLLMLCAIPFLVVIGCSVFTDAAHMHDHDYGVKKYPSTKVHSLTFAAIVDDSLDNGTLQYMNTAIANTWNGPMRKSGFLIWISLVDAASALLFLLGLAALWSHLKRFALVTDKNTLEAADFTVLVRGLPADADEVQVGQHFSRYGEVMDVVLVTDRLSETLRHCGRAAKLRQREAMVEDAFQVRPTDKSKSMMEKLKGRRERIEKKIGMLANRNPSLKAAFVTFNAENERRTCQTQCPSGWLGSLIQRSRDRFKGEHRFWVRQACAPDDYKFEDLAVSEWQLFAREVAINVAMLLLVAVCAAAIAKLTDISNQESSTLSWHTDRLLADSAASMLLVATNGSPGATNADPNVAGAGNMFGGELMPQLEAFCTRQLRDTCRARLASEYGGLVTVTYGYGLEWVNATSRLLFERAVEEELVCSTRTARTDGGCGLQGCLPCLCLGVSRNGSVASMDAAFVASASESDTESVCSPYINYLDIRSWGIRLSISAVVALLNVAIKWVLSVLVQYGRHWTHTARERSFALQCFVSMLANTVVVLLVTNSEALGRMARESQAGAWTRFFVRYGSYSDFTPGWYENVGLSILILMMINVGSPLLTLAVEALLQTARQCCVRYCITWPLQSDYDTAWAKPRFTLAQRVADLLLNVSLAMLFGSGMPLLYLVLAVYLLVAELADRWAITKLCCSAPRYNTGLTQLVMDLLPWLVAAHCAFGVWMHTYFRVVVPNEGGKGLEEVSALSVAVNNARLASSSADLAVLQHSSVWQRITQPNGLPLLLLLLGLVVALLIGRFLVWKLLSCLVATGRLCCLGRGERLMRFQIYEDTQLQVNTLPYAKALESRQLHDMLKSRQQRGTREPRQQQGTLEPRQLYGTREPRQQQGTLEPSQQQGTLEPSQLYGTLEPSQQHGTLEPSQQHGALEPSQQQGTLEPSQQHGALESRRLHGTPTYRLELHPYYQQYFATSGQRHLPGNTAGKVLALVMSAANGKARKRTMFTRLVQRGQLPSGAAIFEVRSTPMMDRGSLRGDDTAAFRQQDGGHHPHHRDGDEVVDMHAEPAEPARIFMDPLLAMARTAAAGAGSSCKSPWGRGAAAAAAGGDGAARDQDVLLAPDVMELLQEEQLRASTASLRLGPGSQPPRQQQPQQQPGGDSPRSVAARTPTAAAVISLVIPGSPGLERGGGRAGGSGTVSRAQSGVVGIVVAAAEAGGADAEMEAIRALAAGQLRAPSQLEASPTGRSGGAVGAAGDARTGRTPPASPHRLQTASGDVGAGSAAAVGPAAEQRTPSPRVLVVFDEAAGATGASSARSSPASTPRSGIPRF
ncbi:hypothetical protein PLESTF_001090500 [Pleodorina starrii]|nr:hypothetical protein PLESTF_001090500 [Pleodorina starrii]